MQWDKTMGGSGSDLLFNISQTTDGGYICGGHSTSSISGEKTQALEGINDYWIVKLNPTSPLPIELISFTGKNNNGKNILEWTTASETNNDYFTLEKSSDAKTFQSITTIDRAGNSTLVLNYSFVDENHFAGINYYRLKQTDFNGAFSYSKTIAINSNSKSEYDFFIYPNPANNFINVFYQNANAKDEIKIINTLGETIIKTNDKNGIDIAALENGIYFVQIKTDNENNLNKKIIIQH